MDLLSASRVREADVGSNRTHALLGFKKLDVQFQRPALTRDITAHRRPNVEIERPPLAVRSNARLGETMPRMQCFGKRQRDEQQASVR